MSSALQELVQVGQDITSTKYYWAALTTILFYDYFLTLQDELQYAWKGKKSWAFAIFFLNRYLPLAYTIWVGVSNFSWAYTYEMCNRSAFVEILFFVWCTLIAQDVLNVRLYAITMKSWAITGPFVCITVAQCAVGIHLTYLAASAPAQQLPPIHLTTYQLCVFTRHRKLEIGYTAMSLIYDFLAFLVIVALAVRSATGDSKMPQILRAIVHDSTTYFLVIFTSHLVLEMTLLLARLSLQLLPAIGNVVYLPLLIGRLMLSLKKAVNASEDSGWSLTSVTNTSDLGRHTSMRFAPRSEVDSPSPTEEDVPLATIPSVMDILASRGELTAV